MAANTDPIFGRTPHTTVGGAVIGSSANTATDGTGSNMYQIFQADATEGSYVYYVNFKSISTCAATVIRIFLCTDTGTFVAGTTNTASNTSLLTEISTYLWTASNLNASPNYIANLNIPIAPGNKLLVSFGTSTGAATTGFNPIVVAMKY